MKSTIPKTFNYKYFNESYYFCIIDITEQMISFRFEYFGGIDNKCLLHAI